ncbi:MAG: EAL domain-containing protein [Methylococcaceae bacterium]|nr:MAG: EAL domain-containing protein [Methylococcaceae bacterium]
MDSFIPPSRKIAAGSEVLSSPELIRLPREQPLILVADDDADARFTMMQGLAAAGFLVDGADCGETALQLFIALQPDLILLDATMPDMDGFSACTTIRQLPGGANIPILIIAGLEDANTVVQALQVGATDFFTKPLNFSVLENRLRQILRGSEVLAELENSKEILKGKDEAIEYSIHSLRQSNEALQAEIAKRQEIEHNLHLLTETLEAQVQKRTTELERASRTKSEFLSRMSHELRTPLNAILGFAQLLKSDCDAPLSPSQQEDLQQIVQSGWHLLNLINAVLDLTRVETGEMAIDVRETAAKPVIESCLQTIAPEAASRGIRLSANLAEAENCPVWADAARLTKVLLNLLSNAIKYNHSDGRINIHCALIENDRLRISIQDTGWGLTAEQQNQLFESFNRLGAESSDIGGAGIGLVIAKRMMELMGGSIGITSQVGEGSTFWIELVTTAQPRAREDVAQATPETVKLLPAVEPYTEPGPEPKPETVPHKKPMILVVDDEEPVRLLIMQGLKLAGFSAEGAGGGAAALELFSALKPDLIMLDVVMPGMDGFAACSAIRQLPGGAFIPILMVTGFDDFYSIERAYQVGATDFITKPINLALLKKRLYYLLRGAELVAEHQRQEAELHTILLTSVDGFLLVAQQDGRLLEVNPAYCEMTGYSREELLQMHVNDLDVIETAEETRLHMGKIKLNLACRFATVHRCKNGRLMDVEVSAKFLDIRGGLFVACVRDISEEVKIRASLELAARVFDACGEAIVVTDDANAIVSVNPAFTRITGYAAADVLGKNPRIFKSGRHGESFYREMWSALQKTGTWQGEIWDRRRNGEVYPKWLSIDEIRTQQGKLSNYVAIFSDITERKAREDSMQRMAHFDPLTSLPNRLLFHARLDLALIAAKRNATRLALLFIDLDRFKHINDALGHVVGDQLLVSVAERLQNGRREMDTVARLGGDEFVIILEATDSNGAAKVAQKIIHDLSFPHALGTQSLISTPSIGIAIYPKDGQDTETLVKHADTAMYYAKDKGRNNYVFFRQEMYTLAETRVELESELRAAVANNQFVLVYQPKRDMPTGRITGMEALIRWNHPSKGLILPDRFIPLAEETGLIIPIGEWVLRTACRQAQIWHDQGLGRLRVAVNVSARQLQDQNLFALVSGILQETGLPPTSLELELTESLLMKNVDNSVNVLRDLKSLGISIAVDDFGTGYSCLNYLKRLSIDVLKIDQSFIRDIASDPEDRAIIQAIISLAHALNLEAVAEGVETLEQEEFLMLKDCHTMQGYFLGRPVMTDEFEALIKQQR